MSGPSAVPPPVTQVMEAAGAWLPGAMARVEERLGRIVRAPGGPIAEDARATLEAGGKRLRPMLVLLCAGRDADEAALRAACAVELVHMATLVHDDVLDAAPLRRGLPTIYASAGPRRATAVGDLLLASAFAELTAADGRAEGQVALLASASVGLAQGELAQRGDAFDLGISAERYLLRCRLKTARLFECACLIGRADGSGDDPAAPALRTFGCELGLAFQLLDDVLDVAGPPERTGKARGTDLLDGTVTLPLILARERDPELARLELRALDAGAAERACERIAATGVLDEVRADARRRVAAAKAALAKAPGLPAEQRELLTLVADGVVERYS